MDYKQGCLAGFFTFVIAIIIGIIAHIIVPSYGLNFVFGTAVGCGLVNGLMQGFIYGLFKRD